MATFKVGDAVKFRDGRTGAVVEVDEKNEKAKCTLDPTNINAGSATRTDWYDFNDLEPGKANFG